MTKRPVVGMDTKRSARAVKGRVLAQVRGEEKAMKRKPFMIGASAVLAAVALLFLVFQLQKGEGDGQKLTTTVLDDRLVVEVHQLTEDNKKELGAQYLNDRENLADNKALIVKYYVKKKPGEIIEANFDQVLVQFKERISGLKNERDVSMSYSEQNNQSEAFAEFSYTLLFQTQGLTDADIHAALREAIVEISYTNLDEEKRTDSFSLGNYATYFGMDEELATNVTKAVSQSGDFLYQIEVAKGQIHAGEPFEMTATLTYTGDEDAVTISHAASPFYYDIAETTRAFNINYFMEEPLLSTELKKGEPLTHRYVVTGGYSEHDSPQYRAFIDQFLAGQTPQGTYTVKGMAKFKVEGDIEDTEMSAEIEFEAK